MSSAEMPLFLSSLTASIASQTKCPVAKIDTSDPSFSNNPFPISNFDFLE